MITIAPIKVGATIVRSALASLNSDATEAGGGPDPDPSPGISYLPFPLSTFPTLGWF